MVFADTDTNTLVGEAPRQERGLGHAGESPARVGSEWVGECGHDVDSLAFDELEK